MTEFSLTPKFSPHDGFATVSSLDTSQETMTTFSDALGGLVFGAVRYASYLVTDWVCCCCVCCYDCCGCC